MGGATNHWDHSIQHLTDECSHSVFDLWEQHGGTTAAGGTAACGEPMRSLVGRSEDEAVYSGLLFTRHAVDLIAAHDATARPLFLLLTLMETHVPFDPPLRYSEPFQKGSEAGAGRGERLRAKHQGLVVLMDAATENVTRALRRRAMWDATLFVWMSDNGAPVDKGGSNAARSKCPPWQCASSPPLCLLARLAALNSGYPRVRPSHWAPSHRLGGSSELPPKSPISPALTCQAMATCVARKTPCGKEARLSRHHSVYCVARLCTAQLHL